MMPRVILCYSYKGGSGRSTGAINIAASFLKQEEPKNVCIVDLDIENPGLHEIFQIEHLPKYSIQHVLRTKELDAAGKILVNAPILLDEYIQDGIVDLRAELMNDIPELFDRDQSLIYLPASPEPKDVITLKGRYAENTLKTLFKKLTDEYHIDYFVIDGASSLRSTSLLPMAISDVILLFFKWSKQHLAGTILTHRWLKTFKENPKTNFKAEVLLIPSGIPQINPEAAEDQYLTGIQIAAQARLIEETGVTGELLDNFKIRDDPLLRWNEKIVVTERADTAYEHIANYIDEMFGG